MDSGEACGRSNLNLYLEPYVAATYCSYAFKKIEKLVNQYVPAIGCTLMEGDAYDLLLQYLF